MLWGHILLSFVVQVASKAMYLTCYSVVLMFTEILPFTMISINMIQRLRVYRKARAMSIHISEQSQMNRKNSTVSSSAGSLRSKHSIDQLHYLDSMERDMRLSMMT